MARAEKAPGKSSQEINQKFSSDRARALDAALGQIEKQFGKGAVMKLGETQSYAGRIYSDRRTVA